MQADFHSNDPKLIWQNQPTEASAVDLVLIRQKARDLHAKARRQRLNTLVTPLIVAFFYGFSVKQFPDLRPVWHSLFAFAFAWSLVGLYFRNQGQKSRALPLDAGFSTGLEFCRQEIQRLTSYFHHGLLWTFAPILLAIATFFSKLAQVAGPEIFSKIMPVMLLLIAWIAAYLFIRARQKLRLEQEVEDLTEIERENRR